MRTVTYTHREVELFQLWAKRARVESTVRFLKAELKTLNEQVAHIQKLIDKENEVS